MDVAIPKPKALHWTALGLLVISVCINYADRGNLGVAAKSIQSELRFSPNDLGILLGSFFASYALFQLVAGKAIDRWNVNWVYAIGFLLWSAATGITGLASSFAAILCLRLALGAGEAVAYPAYSKIIATVFPESLRGTANALIDVGSKIGPALGVLLGVKLLNRYTWRGMFVIIAVASFVWLLPWCFVAPRLAARRITAVSAWSPSYRQLMTKRPFWGTVLGLFGGNYGWYFLLSWLPYYFETVRHYSRDQLAIFASLPFWAIAVSSMFFGLLADALIRRGREPGRVRQVLVSCGLLGCCIFMLPAVIVQQNRSFNILILLASVSMGAFSSNHWALTQRLSGAAAAGKWTGFENCIGNFAGIAAGSLSGSVLTFTHSFFAPFAIACTFLVLGSLGFLVIIGRPTQVSWLRKETAEALEPYIVG